jgi:hypothetical protein
MLKQNGLIEILGWYGAAAILAAYGLVSFEVISSDSLAYQLLNLTGALGIVSVSITKKAKQPAVLNIVWALIAAVAIVEIVA